MTRAATRSTPPESIEISPPEVSVVIPCLNEAQSIGRCVDTAIKAFESTGVRGEVVVADHVFAYAVDLVRATRPREPDAPKFIPEWIAWGAGPRASQYLILAAKAHAILQGRHHVSADDVSAVALPILRHRLIVNFTAQSEGVTVDEVIKQLVRTAAKAVAA